MNATLKPAKFQEHAWMKKYKRYPRYADISIWKWMLDDESKRQNQNYSRWKKRMKIMTKYTSMDHETYEDIVTR
jgi:hypothetical protein